jgi:hypothetical protein
MDSTSKVSYSKTKNGGSFSHSTRSSTEAARDMKRHWAQLHTDLSKEECSYSTLTYRSSQSTRLSLAGQPTTRINVANSWLQCSGYVGSVSFGAIRIRYQKYGS